MKVACIDSGNAERQSLFDFISNSFRHAFNNSTYVLSNLKVSTCSNVNELNGSAPDLVVLGQSLSTETAFKMAEKLKEKNPDILILAFLCPELRCSATVKRFRKICSAVLFDAKCLMQSACLLKQFEGIVYTKNCVQRWKARFEMPVVNKEVYADSAYVSPRRLAEQAARKRSSVKVKIKSDTVVNASKAREILDHFMSAKSKFPKFGRPNPTFVTKRPTNYQPININ